MKHHRLFACILAALAAGTLAASPSPPPAGAAPPVSTPAPAATPPHSAITPVARTDAGWVKRNEAFNDRARQGAAKGDIGVIFIGDSITHQWETAGKKVWDEFYTKRGAVNFGIGGDRTQHVLWRVQNGNFDGLAKPATGSPPKLVVLMIGTNNSNGSDNTASEIADGIRACIAGIRGKLPEAKILLLSIFPRGEKPGPQREKNAEASRLAAESADGQTVHHLDLTGVFLDKDGTLSREIMPDLLHLSERGYRLWAEAIEAKVRELLGEK
jgi:lysophospholipase L1-like esterase